MPWHTPTPGPLAERTRLLLERHAISVNEGRRREYYDAHWWRTTTVLDDFEAAWQAHPDKTAVVSYRSGADSPHRLSYRDLAARVERTAAALLHLGVGEGDVVSVQLPNCWQFNVIALATARVGAAVNPIVAIHRRREVAFITGLLQSKICFVPGNFHRFDYAAMLAAVAGEVPSLQHRVIVTGAASDGELSFEQDLLDVPWEERYRDQLAALSVDPDQVADIQFTSGTTGEPKGVGHTHNTQYARARALYDTLSLGPDDTVFMPSPLTHSTGFVYGYLTPMMLGMTAVYQDVWEPDRALRILEREHATWSFGSTAFIVDLIRAQRQEPRDISALRYFVSGGAAIPPAAVAEARDVLGARVMAVWGMTENGAVTCTRLQEAPDAAAHTDGKPCPWMQLKVVDMADDTEVPAGTPGRLKVRGASQMLGYVKRPNLTDAAVDADGWFDTGDLAYLDEAGSLRITGRAKDIIIRGGENIPVADVEAVLYEHPSVVDIAIVAYPDERLGERACAVVVPAGDLTLADLTAYLDRAGMAKTYWPERLELRTEMPRTLSGKIQKFRLRDDLATGQPGAAGTPP
jgi:cyclohexanecarboxylate-CoA ligase